MRIEGETRDGGTGRGGEYDSKMLHSLHLIKEKQRRIETEKREARRE
jgi:hypothetical protein